MLELVRVSKKYESKKDNIEILSNISIVLPQKGVVFISGDSGVGKTSLLNIMATFEMPTIGYVTYNRKKINLIKYRSEIISYVFQDLNLFDDLTIYENLNISGRINIQKTKEILEMLNLNLELKTKVKYLSLGEKQRLAFCRAILKDFNILFLDEPTSSLDEKNSHIIMNYVKHIGKEKLVILITHSSDYIDKYGDYLIEVREKKVGQIIHLENQKNDEPFEKSELENLKYNGKSSFPFNLQLKYALTLFGKNRIKFFLLVFIITLLTCINSHFINNHFIDHKVELSNILEEKNVVNNIIFDSNGNNIELEESIKIMNQMDINQYSILFHNNDKMKTALKIDLAHPFKSVKLERGTIPLKNNEVLITDYINSLDPTLDIGKEIEVNTIYLKCKFIISGIIKTNYSLEKIQQMKINKDNDYILTNYKYVLTSDLLINKYIEKTGFYAFDNVKIDDVKNENIKNEITKIYQSQNLVLGRKPSNLKEVVVSQSLLKKYKIYDIKSALNKLINVRNADFIDELNESQNMNTSYYLEIVGIVDDVTDYFVYSDFKDIKYKLGERKNVFFTTSGINKGNISNLPNDIMLGFKDYRMMFYELRSLDDMYYINLIVNLISMGITILFIYFFSLDAINSKKREILILQSLGIKNNKIFTIFYIHNAIYSIIGFIGGILFLFFAKEYITNSITIKIYFQSFIIVILLSLIIPLFSTKLSMLRLRRVSISEFLKRS